MKTAKTTLAILLALCMLLGLTSAAFADETLDRTVTVDGDTVSVGGNEITFKTDGSCTDSSIPITNDTNGVTVNAIIDTIIDGGDGVEASGGATVTVTGSVTGYNTGVVASDENTSVTVGDSVTGKYDNGVEASGGATVTVTNGDVTGNGDNGVEASGGATVTVTNGDVTGHYDGVNANSGATVTVTNGSVTGNKDGVYATGGSTVTVTGGDVTGDNFAGVEVNNGNVTVTGGDVTGKYGVYAIYGGTVTVSKDTDGNGGNVTGTNSVGVGAYDGGTVTVEGGNVTGTTNGINALRSSNVSVTGGNVTGNGGNGISATEGSTVTVTGNVTGNGGNGITATGPSTAGGTTTEGGTVTGEGDGTGATGQSTPNITIVKVTGNVTGKGGSGSGNGVEATGGTDVTVTGSVTGYDTGVVASGGATVTVDGSVEGYGGVVAIDGGTVTIEGDVTANIGVEANNGGTVTVDGDVKAGERGILVGINNVGDAQSTILVQGTVSAGKTGTDIVLNVPFDCSVEAVKEVLPEIIVQSIDTSADYVVFVNGDTANKDIAQEVIDSIKYIVETETQYQEGADNTVTVDLINYETTTVGSQTLNVATKGTQLQLAVDKTKGSIVGVTVGNLKTETNPDGNSITQVEDGSWVITVGIGGGLKIIATVAAAEPEPQPEPQPEPKKETKAQPQPERRAATKLNAGAGATAPVRDSELVTVDYKNRTLIIDLIWTNTVTLLTDTLRRFQKTNGIDTVKILVPNGSFTIAMADLLEMLGKAPALTLVSADSTLEMRARGFTVATLVMSTAA